MQHIGEQTHRSFKIICKYQLVIPPVHRFDILCPGPILRPEIRQMPPEVLFFLKIISHFFILARRVREKVELIAETQPNLLHYLKYVPILEDTKV